MKKRIITGTALLFVSTAIFAGGDNTVGVADLKEATYKLVVDYEKANENLTSLNERLGKIEPLVPSISKNTQSITDMVKRLNELGVPATTTKNKAVNDEISNYVNNNRYLLPQEGVK